ncbi:MAG: YoaK family protein [Lachnospiraceae bacterium]|nr:YoaK family protein [Lachnospiraceae bacterium]
MFSGKKYETHLHFLMAGIGGYFGAYSLLNRCDLFGSAQTANLLTSVFCLANGKFYDLILRVGAMLIYGAAFAIAIILAKRSPVNVRKLSIIMSSLTAILLCFLPSDMNNLIALYPVFFITALQWSVFKGTDEFASATIFSTNNYRQAVSGFTEYFLGHEEKQLRKGRFYAFTLLSFHTGALVCCFISKHFGLKSSLFVLLPLAIAYYVVEKQEPFQAVTLHPDCAPRRL